MSWSRFTIDGNTSAEYQARQETSGAQFSRAAIRRRAEVARLSQTADGHDLWTGLVRNGGERDGFKAMSGTIGEHVPRLYQPAGRATRAVHVLRFLRKVR